MVEMNAVDSRSLARIGFDAHREELHVQFRRSDNVYVYEGVSREIYAELLAAESKGAFVNARIKSVHPFRVQKRT